MRRDPTRSVEVKETFQGFRINKIRRNSAFAHRAIAAKSAKGEKTLWRFHRGQSFGGVVLSCIGQWPRSH
jgi:hypothetical protein